MWCSQTYEQISKSFQVSFIDPYHSFLHRKDYFADEVHPNQKGHDQLAKLWISCYRRNKVQKQRS